jgi:hypothetical protein
MCRQLCRYVVECGGGCEDLRKFTLFFFFSGVGRYGGRPCYPVVSRVVGA